MCISFSFHTFYIFMKSEYWVSLIRKEGVLCDMFCQGTKHYCSFLSFVRIYRVSQMNNLKYCNYSVIYVKWINLHKQIGMYRGRLCEGIMSFYWETSNMTWSFMFLYILQSLKNWESEAASHVLLVCFPANITNDGDYVMRCICGMNSYQ
jgi:hypothetical protein